MQFSDLTLEKVVLEIRYDSAPLFWDNSGKAARTISAKYPKLELINAQLSNVQSNLWDEGIVLNFSNIKADVTQDFPGSVETFKAFCSVTCQAISQYLELREYTRVGIRYIYSYPFKTREDARDFFLKLKLIEVAADRLKLFGPMKMEEQQIMLRFEDEDRGYSVRLGHSPREVTLHLSRPFTANTEKFHTHVVIFDLDCYTKKRVEVAAFQAADFIRITHRTAEIGLLRIAGL